MHIFLDEFKHVSFLMVSEINRNNLMLFVHFPYSKGTCLMVLLFCQQWQLLKWWQCFDARFVVTPFWTIKFYSVSPQHGTCNGIGFNTELDINADMQRVHDDHLSSFQDPMHWKFWVRDWRWTSEEVGQFPRLMVNWNYLSIELYAFPKWSK